MKKIFRFNWVTALAVISMLGMLEIGISSAQDCPESAFGTSTCSPTDTIAVTGRDLNPMGTGDSIIIGDQLVVTMDLDSSCVINEYHLAAFKNQEELDMYVNGGGNYAVGKNAQASSEPGSSSALLAVNLPADAEQIGICVAHAAATCNGEDVSVTLGTDPISPNEKNWFTSFPCGTLCSLGLTCTAIQDQGSTGPAVLAATGENLSSTTLNPIIAMGGLLSCDGFDDQGLVFNAFSIFVQVTGSGFSILNVGGIFDAENPLIVALAGSFDALPASTTFPGFIAAILDQADEDLSCQWSCFLGDEVTAVQVDNGNVNIVSTGDVVTGSACFEVTGASGGAEICNDGVDNDGDGDIDCVDADCDLDPGCLS